MYDVCLTCGSYGEIEAHHVAGRHNHQTLTVSACIDCHRILSTWQLAGGLELRADAQRTDADATRALVVGACHLVQLYAQRHPGHSWIPPDLAVHTSRAMSVILDGIAPPDRPGRWLPDPTVPPTDAMPVPWPTDEISVRWVQEFAAFVLQIAHILGEEPPLQASVVEGMACDPHGWAQQLHDHSGGLAGLMDQVAAYTSACQQLILSILQRLNPAEVDSWLISEARACLDIGHELIHQLTDTGNPLGGRDG